MGVGVGDGGGGGVGDSHAVSKCRHRTYLDYKHCSIVLSVHEPYILYLWNTDTVALCTVCV